MKRKTFVLGEWFFRITGPAQARRGRVRVTVENADECDRMFAKSLANVIEVWIVSGGRR